ncbi:deoxyribodipyrimidine photo-lyase [Vermiphilus pyriformis]|jgi:deoxyribodipyrimidine photo-lyase|uniref:Photolyase/cryptochrome alpha/beta domain-containing protein n=1 Tax=candidate division TM6 bacterium JCVI TM6SC1 TaxID=1306947 RepID=A0A0D2JE93_9BACT|nr:hypothetical protein J120_00150 [candidate division TM6 bacterium JCVI TM6SC1]UNE34964.1 MAG: deoxyribodipyrimidine photo-lyase [Vermiphilus pyriformis]
MKLHRTTLFIFRRDLRLEDNIGLNHALKNSEKVITAFILDPLQIGPDNTYKSDNCIEFMFESIKDLSDQIASKHGYLNILHGSIDTVLNKLIEYASIDALVCNYDYTPYSARRDLIIKKICEQKGIAFYQFHDLLINSPDSIMNTSGKPYRVFAAFYKHSLKIPVTLSENKTISNLSNKKLIDDQGLEILDRIPFVKNSQIHVHGGSRNGHKLLKRLHLLENYPKTHDIPSIPTSNLSAHNKFGTISIRQVHTAISLHVPSPAAILRQLYWRDFYTYVAYYSPYVFGNAFVEKYNALHWNTNENDFKIWTEGLTGFPIVDAALRQINITGYMHNRCRLIVASFLTKDLHINWQWGEKYFAQKLVDYDPCVNNGNWQWVASTGCNASPYFRVFNPWLQQKKFDPECVYIKTWIPELEKVPSKVIHNWDKLHTRYPLLGYPKPMVNHSTQAAITKNLFKHILK